ncbi:MAG: hypothetical protein QOE47_2988, partial [Pyrinomonadaceae bacterium]|nr:hypothetical protein [Pyrinomonadaceae bacterium]
MSRRLPDFTRVFSTPPAASFFSTPPVASLFSTLAPRTTFKVLLLVSCACLLLSFTDAHAQRKRRAPSVGGQQAVVVDERLAALRDAPQLTATLVQRLGRGRAVSIIGVRRVGDGGLNFYRVAVTRRTRGWLQAEAIASPSRAGDDEKLLRLIRGSEEFDRIARARIFLDNFLRSPLRPVVLLLFGDEAEAAAAKLTRDAARRLDEREMAAGGAPVESYFLNFNELDRYNKQGIKFVFERAAKRFRYDGESWREI